MHTPWPLFLHSCRLARPGYYEASPRAGHPSWPRTNPASEPRGQPAVRVLGRTQRSRPCRPCNTRQPPPHHFSAFRLPRSPLSALCLCSTGAGMGTSLTTPHEVAAHHPQPPSQPPAPEAPQFGWPLTSSSAVGGLSVVLLYFDEWERPCAHWATGEGGLTWAK